MFFLIHLRRYLQSKTDLSYSLQAKPQFAPLNFWYYKRR